MADFIPGQRWISNTESELGLGLILEVSFKRITVLFLASDERRIYASDNAPLTRVKFAVGDIIESIDEDKLTVTSLIEAEGLITYVGKNKAGEELQLEEIELNHHIQFNKPQDRLFTGQLDPSSWFLLRYETRRRLQQLQQSPVKGLLGGRVSLIPHQLYIAQESANRSAPRIMLADEVGLGKTIEAGLILHHRLINGLTNRVLIIVPESLLHQWLVEMLRRFNLHFSVFDEERCLEELNDDGLQDDDHLSDNNNPFLSEQLVLCSQQFFSNYPRRQQQALQAGWDMVIVDEAHHLKWSEQSASPEFQFVEQLGLRTPSLILLTATPEQLGKESHFARLRLLDPDRFYSFSAFLEEERLFEPVADAAKILLAEQALDEQDKQNLTGLLKDDNVDNLLRNLSDPLKSTVARQSLINILLDHHGTGRILFRNSRQTIQGFPERERQGYALVGAENNTDLKHDPRFIWLVDILTKQVKGAEAWSLRGQKALLICKHAQTAIDLEETLKNRAGIAAAVFHEGMSIIERDRAAAYFADQESAARLLICSEIGSEGRNFQFVHHLILWDLPTNPDLLQQRIGRLDRIGQKHIIQIHIPYIVNTVQHRLYQWYDQGLNAFRSNNSAAQAVADQLQAELSAVLADEQVDMAAFVEQTYELSSEIEEQLQHGRDQLLELNSCRKDVAEQLITQLNHYEHEGLLWPYMVDLFDCFGVDTEYHSADCFIVRPSDQLRVSNIPGLSEDGMTITANRELALAREDLKFLTWEHPMVTGAMELVLSTETGNAVVSVIHHPELKAGQFLLECLFIIECSAPAELQIGRFLPPTPIRVLINQHKVDLTLSFEHSSLIETGKNFDKDQIVSFLNNQRTLITQLITEAEKKAKDEMQELIESATNAMLTSLAVEIKRLIRLKKVNPTIKEEEIELLKDMTMLAHENIQAAHLRLDAVRFVITS